MDVAAVGRARQPAGWRRHSRAARGEYLREGRSRVGASCVGRPVQGRGGALRSERCYFNSSVLKTRVHPDRGGYSTIRSTAMLRVKTRNEGGVRCVFVGSGLGVVMRGRDAGGGRAAGPNPLGLGLRLQLVVVRHPKARHCAVLHPRPSCLNFRARAWRAKKFTRSTPDVLSSGGPSWSGLYGPVLMADLFSVWPHDLGCPYGVTTRF